MSTKSEEVVVDDDVEEIVKEPVRKVSK